MVLWILAVVEVQQCMEACSAIPGSLNAPSCQKQSTYCGTHRLHLQLNVVQGQGDRILEVSWVASVV